MIGRGRHIYQFTVSRARGYRLGCMIALKRWRIGNEAAMGSLGLMRRYGRASARYYTVFAISKPGGSIK